MNWKMKPLLGMALAALATQAAAQVTFYEGEGFHGRMFSTDRPVGNLEGSGFNDRASSVVIEHGRWEVCEHANFQGQCVVLRPGRYDTLRSLGMNDRISSVRPVDREAHYEGAPPPPEGRYEGAPPPVAVAPAYEPAYEYRRRPEERVFEVPVSAVHAVVGPPERRCWVERQQVVEDHRGEPNVGGAILGGILGGVLGHQVGSGRGKDVATVGGAVAGAAIGSNVGREGGVVTGERDVQKCAHAPSGPPQYWDVMYFYRGVEHHVQMNTPPGRTILVNGHGEPRV